MNEAFLGAVENGGRLAVRSAKQPPETDDGTLRVVIRIEPEGNCPLIQFDVNPDHIEAQFSGNTCLCRAILNRGENVIKRTKEPIHDDCACTVFHEHACLVDITDADESGITITTHVSDRAALEELIQSLKTISDSVTLQELVTTSDTETADRVERVDLSSLTEKQQSAVELAIEKGYYNRPSETSLEEMATELGISEQALSQRLGAVEEKLITQLFGC